MSKQDDLARAAYDLRPALAAYFAQPDITRDLGHGTAFPASADIPGGLRDRDRFFRTDLDFPCLYDSGNTQWLTVQVFEVRFPLTTYSANTEDTANLEAMPGDYTIWAVRQDVIVNTGVTNTGAAFWTIDWRDGATTTIGGLNTSASAASTSRIRLVRTSGFTALGAASVFHNMRMTKTGAPSNIDMYAVCRYRLIIT